MTMITSSSSAAPCVGLAPAADCPLANDPQASLLPDPSAGAVDPLLALAYLQAKSRSTGLEDARGDINVAKNDRERFRKLERVALQEAAEARDEGGVWRDISQKCGTLGKLAAVGGSVALAAGTGGAATPAVVLAWSGAGLSAASFVQGQTHALQAFGVDDTWATRIELGMAVTSAVCSGGAAWAGADQASKVLATTARVTTGIGGAAQMASGVATYTSARYEKEVGERMADAAEEHMRAEQRKRKLLRLISDIGASEETDRNTMASLRGAIEAKDQCMTAALRRV